MVATNTESQRTAFTVTVDYRHGTTTGISANDRAATIKALIDPGTRPADLARPGHIHVLRAREGGVLKRAGHTEASVDLARMAGLYPAGMLCEIVTEDKLDMARLPDLEQFAAEHKITFIGMGAVAHNGPHGYFGPERLPDGPSHLDQTVQTVVDLVQRHARDATAPQGEAEHSTG